MKEKQILDLLERLMNDHGVPRNVKTAVEESLQMLNGQCSHEEKIASIISALDDASTNPNLSMQARTSIWSVMSNLESLKQEK